MENNSSIDGFTRILIKWKKVIIIVTLIAILATLAYCLFLSEKTYKGTASVLLPYVGDKLIIQGDDAKNTILNESFLAELSDKTGLPQGTLISHIDVDYNPGSQFITVYFNYCDKEKIPLILSEIRELLNNNISQIYTTEINLINANIEKDKKDIERLTNEQNEVYKKLIDSQKSGESSSLYLNYSITLNTYYLITTNLQNVKTSLVNLENLIRKSHMFVFLVGPAVNEKPSPENTLVKVFVAGFLSFFGLIFMLALFDYFKGLKNQE